MAVLCQKEFPEGRHYKAKHSKKIASDQYRGSAVSPDILARFFQSAMNFLKALADE